MKYLPFETIEEVERFYCHSIWKDNKEYHVVDAIYDCKLTMILLDVETQKEIKVTAEDCVKNYTFIGKPFGKSREK